MSVKNGRKVWTMDGLCPVSARPDVGCLGMLTEGSMPGKPEQLDEQGGDGL